MMVIDNGYEIGETVYLKTDVEQWPRIIIAITVYMAGALQDGIGNRRVTAL